jgi:hypothetical protein
MSVSINHVLSSKLKPTVTVFQYLIQMDEKLVRAGFPPLSEYWKSELRRFYKTGKLRLVARIGRRGGKSSSACRLVVAEAMAGLFVIPPGDTGVFAILSTRTKDARARLKNVQDVLKALGIPFIRRKDEIELKGKPIIFSVYPNNWRASVGMTCIGILCDEVARWHDKDTNANPANEVLKSIRPTMATMVKYGAKEILLSSPWAKSDIHYEYFEKGETDEQCVLYAPTWVAHPELTWNMCKKLEPDDETFKREYEAIPMDSEESQFYDDATLTLAMSGYSLPRYASIGQHVVAGADFGFLSDWSALAVCNIIPSPDDLHKYYLADLQVKKPMAGKPLLPSEVCEFFGAVCAAHKVKGVMLDGHNKASILEHFGRVGLSYFDAPKYSGESHIRCRMLMRQGRLHLPKDESLRKEFLSMTGKPMASGKIKVEAPRGKGKDEGTSAGHADRVNAIVNATWQRAGYVIEDEQRALELNLQRTENVFPGMTQEEVDSIYRLEKRRLESVYGGDVELEELDIEDFLEF